MHLYNIKMLKKIGSGLGEVIKIDVHTNNTIRGKYARIAVAVDLGRPLVSKVQMRNILQIIEYENTSVICSSVEE